MVVRSTLLRIYFVRAFKSECSCNDSSREEYSRFPLLFQNSSKGARLLFCWMTIIYEVTYAKRESRKSLTLA